MITIKKVDVSAIPIIIQLANLIWPLTYKDILTEEQIAYMMNLFYSEQSLKNQMERGHQFILALKDGIPVAYSSYFSKNKKTIHLQKIYVMPDLQGHGIGQLLLGHIINDIEPFGYQAMTLNVNRYNKAVDFYKRIGFEILKEEDIDIGNGYFMNDYVMQKNIV
ncbi:GNAT family N-acetyltransferase [Ferruginibacter albus]|uniref:GNAT family N-acetyltransferase n=1 Tax=Ferruginibacter albus TaxID=2875540 RepID=UPI001CC690C6|nr:GNAT family N-acetyltransferase [Ferruginibacter albus]UAY50805.1 GNAT family N-acetyltransferase [Ferruginibacter albus]